MCDVGLFSLYCLVDFVFFEGVLPAQVLGRTASAIGLYLDGQMRVRLVVPVSNLRRLTFVRAFGDGSLSLVIDGCVRAVGLTVLFFLVGWPTHGHPRAITFGYRFGLAFTGGPFARFFFVARVLEVNGHGVQGANAFAGLVGVDSGLKVFQVMFIRHFRVIRWCFNVAGVGVQTMCYLVIASAKENACFLNCVVPNRINRLHSHSQ